jgi:hypothetical protein
MESSRCTGTHLELYSLWPACIEEHDENNLVSGPFRVVGSAAHPSG